MDLGFFKGGGAAQHYSVSSMFIDRIFASDNSCTN